jgi:hypothetical protein
MRSFDKFKSFQSKIIFLNDWNDLNDLNYWNAYSRNHVQTPISMRASVWRTSFAALFIEFWMVSLSSSSPRG